MIAMNVAPHSIFPGLPLVAPNPDSHPSLQRLFHMTSLIEGWFLVRKKGEDDSLNLTNSRKSYLSIFDSLPSLGPISTEIYIDCELRLYPGPGGGERLEDQVIHAHGRFCINSTGEAPTLQMEVHRFDIMAVGESIPDTLCTSVTLCGRVGPPEEAPDGLDKFFTLEINEYIRDRTQMFNIRFGGSISSRILTDNLSRCRLNRTSSKRWEKAVVPSQGITVLVSSFLDGDSPQALVVEVETMQFLSTARGAEGAGPSQSPGKSKFGVPNRSVYHSTTIAF